MKLNIPAKISFSVVLIIFVVFGIITYLVTHEWHKKFLELVEFRAETLAQQLFSEIPTGETKGQFDQRNFKQIVGTLSSVCQQLYETNKEKPLTHIAVLDRNGTILAHNDPTLTGKIIESQRLLEELGWIKTITVLDGMIYHTLVPVLSGEGTYLSSIDIGYPKEVYDDILRQFLIKIAKVLAICLVMTSLSIVIIVHLMVTKPITYLIQVGNRLTQGHLIETIQFDTREDELAHLGAVFVSLSKYLREVTKLATQIASGSLDQHQIQKRSGRDMLGSALQNMLTYLRTVAASAKSIAEGDLSMTIPLRSDSDAFGRTLQQMMSYLREMADAATVISTGDLCEQVTPRSERDVLGKAYQGMTAYLNRLATAATAIAAGDLQQDAQPESERDVLGNAFHTMAVQLREDFEKIQQEVAERSRAQEELQKLNEELERRVEKRTAELVQYREHLEDLVEERTIELTRSNTRLNDEIVERRRIEQALRVSEEQYRLLAENVKDGIVIVQNEKLVFTNAVFAAMTGYSPEQLVMTDPLCLFYSQSAQTARTQLTSDDPESPIPRWQAQIVTRGNRTIWSEIVQTRIVWNSQPATLLTIRDITDRKLREQRLEEERARLEEENLSLKSSIKERYRFGSLVGKSPVMQRIYELIVSAANSEVNVLVCGESGTGKELIARTLHQVSRRKAQTFVPVNCASIPETLFEREFFGHRKGAFTGADRDTPGLFDRAHRGTLFLDEVTELSPGTQAKLLRVLQDGEYTPLGGTTPRQADVLIVAATNKDCQQEIAHGRLRKDFFYRIAGIEIRVPPLRERKDDLSLLIEHVLEEYQQKQTEVRGNIPQDLPANQTMLPGEIVQALYTYEWPGNIRELQNVLQRYLVTQDVNAILSLLGTSAHPRLMSESSIIPDGLTLPEAVQAFERRMIVDILAQNDYHITKTAEMLGIPRITLHRKIKKHQVRTKKLKNI